MPKFFVTADIHGFFDEFKSALDESGFDENHPDHWLICCGDLLDRGEQPNEVIKYLTSIKNKILVRGNHEDLIEECIERAEPWMHDYNNGTYGTICELGDAGCGLSFEECCNIAWHKTRPLFNQTVNYFETEHYVFVHSCIPLKKDWRNANAKEWYNARWGNPFDFWEQVEIENKTAVFGHWHTSYYNSPLYEYYNSPLYEFGNKSDFGIAYGDGFIGLDACTAFSGKVNVLVIEDEFIKE